MKNIIVSLFCVLPILLPLTLLFSLWVMSNISIIRYFLMAEYVKYSVVQVARAINE